MRGLSGLRIFVFHGMLRNIRPLHRSPLYSSRRTAASGSGDQFAQQSERLPRRCSSLAQQVSSALQGRQEAELHSIAIKPATGIRYPVAHNYASILHLMHDFRFPFPVRSACFDSKFAKKPPIMGCICILPALILQSDIDDRVNKSAYRP